MKDSVAHIGRSALSALLCLSGTLHAQSAPRRLTLEINSLGSIQETGEA